MTGDTTGHVKIITRALLYLNTLGELRLNINDYTSK